MRKEHTSLLGSSTADSTALERAKLQMEGLKTSLTEAQGKCKELERTNSDLSRQLEKRQNLESRDSTEVDDLRQKKVDLDIRVAALESELEELTKAAKEREDKTQSKLQKYKASLAEHAVS